MKDSEPPVEKSVQRSLGGVPDVEGGTYATNAPSYKNQQISVSSSPEHSELENVNPIFTIGQPDSLIHPSKSVSSFPVQMDSSHFDLPEADTTHDSTESLPVYVNPSSGHPIYKDVFMTSKVPAHAQPLVVQLAHQLYKNRSDPLLIVPGDTSRSGYAYALPDNYVFLFSRNGNGSRFKVKTIPATSSFLEVHNKSTSSVQAGSRVIRAPHKGFIVVTPEGEFHYVKRPMVILPGNAQRPLRELPLLESDSPSVQFDDTLSRSPNLRKGVENSTTSESYLRDQSTVDNAQTRQQDANHSSLLLNSSSSPAEHQRAPEVSMLAHQICTSSVLPPLQQQLLNEMPRDSRIYRLWIILKQIDCFFQMLGYLCGSCNSNNFRQLLLLLLQESFIWEEDGSLLWKT
ncbi:hypothetical protein Aperf_G00000099395 [Anoplocephala perfoliata]